MGEGGGVVVQEVVSPPAVALQFKDVAFSYPGDGQKVLRGASASIPSGAFALLTGSTGSGKTTLLRLAKREIRPEGSLAGSVLVEGQDVATMDEHASAQAVGYVFQRPENQIVCDSVWHEMAFGLENLATPRDVMRRRIAETCSYLGMEPWFRANVDELSGGQRQVCALASVLVMQPKALLLDEPVSMLDPVAERRFMALLYQLNRDKGITVVVATHAPERMAAYATMRLHLADGLLEERPLDEFVQAQKETPATPSHSLTGSATVQLADVWMRYSRDGQWVARGLSLDVQDASVHALVGNNGSGKSTVLSLIAGVVRAQRGKVRNSLLASQALLPQDPKMLLACQTVGEELTEWVPEGQRKKVLEEVLAMTGLQAELLGSHPYDLSGGQQQLVAFGKLLATHPKLLLLDEPTKGLDASGRTSVAQVVSRAREEGTTIVVATHDLDFVRQVATTVSLLFDGQIAVTDPVDEYFSHTWLY